MYLHRFINFQKGDEKQALKSIVSLKTLNPKPNPAAIHPCSPTLNPKLSEP